MGETREQILRAALCLFARDGYEAVSVSMISGSLGMTKGALYKHFTSKHDILDSIVLEMERKDAQHSEENSVPSRTVSEMPEQYKKTTLSQIKTFSLSQFDYWTVDPFASCFRRMLTLEQYRSAEMAGLYSQYLSEGPLSYIEDLFFAICGDREIAGEAAIRFYAPMFLCYSIFDLGSDRKAVRDRLEKYISHFKMQKEE